MKSRLNSILERTLLSTTGRNSVITVLSMVVNTGFSAAFFIILARELGPGSLGLFSVALALMSTVSGIADWGTSFGMLRFVSASKKDSLSYLKLGLYAKLVFGVTGTLIIALSGNAIASFIFHRPELGPLFVLSSLGVLGGLLYSYGLTSLQSLEKFLPWGILQIGWTLLRFLLLLIVVYLNILNPSTSLGIYLAVLFVVFIGAIPFLPKGMMKSPISRVQLTNFFGYNKWMAFYTVLITLAGSFDRFFLARFSAPSEVGFYVAATQIAGVGIQIQAALGTVLIPRFASLDKLSAIRSYLKKTVLLTGTLSVGGVLIALISEPLTLLVFGESYLQSIAPLRLLIVSVAFYLASLPFTSTWLYTLGKARDFSLYFFFNCLLLFLLNWMLVPAYGAVGSAFASLVGNAVTLLVSIIYVQLNLRKSFS